MADSGWQLVSGGDPRALAVVDGTGRFRRYGPHYSRRSPGSRTFTGVGKEIVLLSECGRAVWAVVLHRAPAAPGSAKLSRGRLNALQAKRTRKQAAGRAQWLWRNVMFRNLGAGLSSSLIVAATRDTYRHWIQRYGALPGARLRTEVSITRAKERGSTNPVYCYLMAGWERGPVRRQKLHLFAPPPEGGAA